MKILKMGRYTIQESVEIFSENEQSLKHVFLRKSIFSNETQFETVELINTIIVFYIYNESLFDLYYRQVV